MSAVLAYKKYGRMEGQEKFLTENPHKCGRA
jgi:hypothetical protein